jgi:dTDP-4-amino-4,6-dideoxygalactose transaminase
MSSQRSHPTVSRRKFVASTSLLVAGAHLGLAETSAEEQGGKLAIEGGAKACPGKMPEAARWGDPELAQLAQAVKQPSLYYWRNKQTELLMERYRKFYPHKFVQPCSSGSAALHIAVAAAGIAPGDEVITSSITDIGTVIGVLFQQAVPVFADLEPYSACLDVTDVERKITARTKAIIAVHLFGNPVRLAEMKELADKHKLILIEDCAQAWGATYKGKFLGSHGQITCFSLQNTKHITCGDGGVVSTNEPALGPLLVKFGDKGVSRLNPPDSSNALAANYRITELQAAFAAAQFNRLEDIASKRAKLGNLLTQELQGVPGVRPHVVDQNDRCVYWFYMLRLELNKLRCSRADFVKALVAEGAPFNPGYIAVPLYGMPMFQKHSFFAGHWPVKEMGLTSMDYSRIKLPVTEEILASCTLFRINEAMSEDYIKAVAQAVRKVAKHYAG